MRGREGERERERERERETERQREGDIERERGTCARRAGTDSASLAAVVRTTAILVCSS